MCIGNLRNATELLYKYRHSKDKGIKGECLRYYGVIAIFALDATLGSILSGLIGEKTIWMSCGLLFISFMIMFVHEQIGDKPEM